MTEENNENNMYDRVIGTPNNTKNRNMMERNIVPGTVIYINYVGIGISKIVESTGCPYIDTTVIPEWNDGKSESYASRVETKLIVNIENPIKPREIHDMGIRYESTGGILPLSYALQTVIPISEEDGYKITRITSIRYWSTIDRNSRMIHLDEIVNNITEALGNDGISYLDTTIDTLPDKWYYNTLLSDMIEEGRDIMNSLGIEKLQMSK